MSKKKILVVDDEKLIVKGIRFSLEQDDMEVDCAYDGEEALQYAKNCEYDLVLLDVMLPKMDGFQVCQAIREFSDMPIVMLTAKSEDMDKILGLEYGADDYITKPFNILEVKARIKAIMRRTARKEESAQTAKILVKGNMRIDCESRRVFIGEREINLTAKEYDVLELLAMNPNKVYSRENLLDLVWGVDYPGDARTVDVHIRVKTHIFKSMRFWLIVLFVVFGLIPCLASYVWTVKTSEQRAISVRTAEIQNQCTILSNQLNSYQYLTNPSSEVIDANLTQLTNIYNGRVMIINQNLDVIKDTYGLDEGKTMVSENVIRCLRQGKSTSYYDKKNRYVEVTAPVISEAKAVTGVMLASVSMDTVLDGTRMLRAQGGAVLIVVFLVVLSLGILVAGWFVRPLGRITASIENVTEGYESEWLHVGTFSETVDIWQE